MRRRGPSAWTRASVSGGRHPDAGRDRRRPGLGTASARVFNLPAGEGYASEMRGEIPSETRVQRGRLGGWRDARGGAGDHRHDHGRRAPAHDPATPRPHALPDVPLQRSLRRGPRGSGGNPQARAGGAAQRLGFHMGRPGQAQAVHRQLLRLVVQDSAHRVARGGAGVDLRHHRAGGIHRRPFPLPAREVRQDASHPVPGLRHGLVPQTVPGSVGGCAAAEDIRQDGAQRSDPGARLRQRDGRPRVGADGSRGDGFAGPAAALAGEGSGSVHRGARYPGVRGVEGHRGELLRRSHRHRRGLVHAQGGDPHLAQRQTRNLGSRRAHRLALYQTDQPRG
mmetsp:Transcript_14297/g.58162  ORF Transcript_14297/g.58162 Transcript_14297/m.58162 type:complete len:337 (-) Transcript_14297:750-1760(-)